ncbi:DUF5667 domain-containing protein [Yinghuangia seranimata]|uniref:DUF5667 domain-containing protein n=1 Tax=Yinghuangia seranimata TaxID=408067 RepID=UPI00248AF9DC|nr:DUF5667 domain-containing protein [Yinghuangia seranimata]MDI2130362.1 DUF5667 domain-containing protein [Yinghuangia seranimata]
MSIAVVDRRRALAFAQAVDEMESGPAPSRGETHGGDQGDVETSAALATVALLREEGAAGPAPSADFRAALRSRLLEEASALPAAGAAVPAPRGAHRRPAAIPRQRSVRWRRRWAVAGSLVVITAGGLGGVAYASTDAVPGDMTYGVKRGLEDLRVSMADSDRERGEEYLSQARTRLAEAETLLDRSGDGTVGKGTIGHLKEVLDDMRDETAHGRALLTETYHENGKVGPMRDLADFARTGTERMNLINDRLPGEVAEQRDLVWNLLYDIHRQVAPIPGAVNAQDVARTGGTLPGPAGRGGAPVGGAPAAPGGQPQSPAGGLTGAVPPLLGAVPGTGQGGEPSPSASSGALPNVNVPLLEPSPSGSGSPSGSPAPLGVDVPAPALPPVNLNVPPLLPGLPGIGITIGGAPQSAPPEGGAQQP